MIPEQKHVFKQILDYIDTEKPATVLIAGDVYDRAIPSVEAVCLFDDFLTELSKKDTAVLLISGNHDSSERLGYASRLLAEKNLHLCGVFNEEISKVVLTDEYGEVNFWLLPFIKPSSLRGKTDDKEIDIDSYDKAVLAALEMSDIDYSKRNVLLSHQFYTKFGVSPILSESEQSPVGGLDAIMVEHVEKFDYVALGHLHRAQSVGSDNIRYCGSPVKYSFSEWKQEKSVTVIEMNEKGKIEITALPLKPIHDMREIKGKLEQLISDEVVTLADNEDYLRVVLTDEDEIIDPMARLRTVYPNVMNLAFENSRTKAEISNITADIDLEKPPSPYELFSEFFLEICKYVMTGEQEKIVRELLEGVESE